MKEQGSHAPFCSSPDTAQILVVEADADIASLFSGHA